MKDVNLGELQIGMQKKKRWDKNMKKILCCLLIMVYMMTNTYSYVYAEQNNSEEQINEEFQVIKEDAEGRLVSARKGNIYYTIVYDEKGQTEYVSQGPYDGENYDRKTNIRYIEKNSLGSVKVIETECDGNIVIEEYDENNNLTKESLKNGTIKAYKYKNNNMVEKIYPYTGTEKDIFNTCLYQYNDKNQCVAIYIPMGKKRNGDVAYNISKYEYDNNGNLIHEKHSINKVEEPELYSKREYEYDAKNNLIKTTEYDLDGEASIVQYYYDEEGHKIREYFGLTHPLIITGKDKVIEGEDNEYGVIQYEYEGDFLVREVDANGGITTYTYDVNGLLSEKTEQDGTRHCYSYRDGLYREKEVIFSNDNPNNPMSTIEYKQKKISENRWGMLYEISDGEEKTEYGYDEKNNLRSETDPNGNKVLYTYDEKDRIQSMEVYDSDNQMIGKIRYTYRINDMIDQIEDGRGNQIAKYDYDECMRVKRETLGESISSEYEYNQSGMLDEIIISNNLEVFHDISYQYATNGNIVFESDVTVPNIIAYDYDGLNRLKSVTEDGEKTAYKYDESGNCLSVVSSNTISASYDTSNHIEDQL